MNQYKTFLQKTYEIEEDKLNKAIREKGYKYREEKRMIDDVSRRK